MISENKRRISICITIVDVTENLVSMMAAGTTVLNGTADVDATVDADASNYLILYEAECVARAALRRRNRENRCAREFVRCMKNARCGY